MKTLRFCLAAGVVCFSLMCMMARPASAQSIQQLIVNNVIQNILQDVRDQIQGRRIVTPPGMMRFSGEESDYDNRNPFALQGKDDPFGALAYAKAPPMAAAPPATWIYGINAVGTGDETHAAGFTGTTSVTGTGAFDVTKIGIFTATDALTFIATGSDTWSHTSGGTLFNSETPSASGTLAYVNGGFSTDFTATASWTRDTAIGLVAPPADSSSMSYTGNLQYKYDLPNTFFIEPTVGTTYTDLYTANFGTWTGYSEEVHGGARFGAEVKWMSYMVQPSLTVVGFRVVETSTTLGAVAGAAAIPGLPAAAGGTGSMAPGVRASGKLNVIWTQNFSSYIEAHAIELAGSDTTGGSVGLRYTW
jgi:hypothetical protein